MPQNGTFHTIDEDGWNAGVGATQKIFDFAKALMRYRVPTAIARALSNEPQIIPADEPTAALDMQRAVHVVKLLRKMAKEQNVAVIMLTHDERLLPYCDKILSIENRKIVTTTQDAHLIV